MRKCLTFAICLFCSAATAHPSFENTHVRGGVTFKADLMVTHGCGDSPTIRLIVDIPEEVVAVTPRVKPGWTIETVQSELSEPRTVFGMRMTKFTSQIIWSGNSLSSDFFDVFSFIVIPPNNPSTLYFPTKQVCEEGVAEWSNTPDPENHGERLSHPAPSLTVVRNAGADGH